MQILKNSEKYAGILILLALGTAFRLIPLGQYQFSHDELSAISRTIYPDLAQELNYGIRIDAHPALVQLFLWFWVKLFGYSEIAIKLPFLLSGIASIWLMYRFCCRFFSEKVALTAGTLVSLSFIFLVYSSYARMYITGVLFSLALLYAVYVILFAEAVRARHYVLFVVSCLLAAYNHHMSSLFAFSVALLALCYIRRERLGKYLLCCGLAILLYLPNLPITLYQLSIGGIGASVGGWLAPPRHTEIWYFVKALFGTGLGARLILALLLGLMLVSVFRLVPISRKQLFLFWIFVFNYLVIHLYSVFRNPILQYSVLLFCGLCLIVFLCSFVEFLKPRQVWWLAGIMTLLLSYQDLYQKRIFSRVHVQDFESQVQTAIDYRQRYGKEQVSAIFKTEDFFVSIYEWKYRTKLSYLSQKDSTLQKPYLLREYLKKLKASYLVLGGAGAEDIALVKEYFPFLVYHREDYFRNTLVFSKQDAHYTDASLVHDMPLLNSDIGVYVNSAKELSYKGDSMSFEIGRSDDEFPFNTSLPLPKADFRLGQFVLAELSYTATDQKDIAQERLCLAVSEKQKDAVFFKASSYADYYDSSKAVQTTYLEYFVSMDHAAWARKGMDLNAFVWKAKESAYTIRQFRLKQYEYNPSKWRLWD